MGRLRASAETLDEPMMNEAGDGYTLLWWCCRRTKLPTGLPTGVQRPSGRTELLEALSGWWRESSDEETKGPRCGVRLWGPATHIRSVWKEADSLDWRREGYSFTQLGHSSPSGKKTLDREGARRPGTGRPGNPIDPGGKAGAASFGTSRQVREKKGTISGLGNDARGTLEEIGLTETPRVVAGDCWLVWRRSSHTRQRPNFHD